MLHNWEIKLIINITFNTVNTNAAFSLLEEGTRLNQSDGVQHIMNTTDRILKEIDNIASGILGDFQKGDPMVTMESKDNR